MAKLRKITIYKYTIIFAPILMIGAKSEQTEKEKYL